MTTERGVAAIDDIDARPGSTASLLRTIIGLYLRRVEWMPTAALVALCGDLGIPAAQARTAITRLKQKGLLTAERGESGAGYRVTQEAVPMLEAGDRRIFAMRRMTDADGWCLVSFSIPEHARGVRHQLRRRLHWIGAGVVSPALWICPGHLQGEVEGILEDLDARRWATLFPAGAPSTADSPAEAAARWWDLEALRAQHLAFLDGISALPTEPFAAYVRLIDIWRELPYVDPGLPSAMLPPDWPGDRSFAEFARLSETLAGPAWEHVLAATR